MSLPLWPTHPDNLARALAGPDAVIVVPCADAAWVEAALRPMPSPTGEHTRVAILDASGHAREGTWSRRLARRNEVILSTWLVAREDELGTREERALVWLVDPVAFGPASLAGPSPEDLAVLATIRRVAERCIVEGRPLRFLVTGADVRLPASLAHVGRVVNLDRVSGGGAAGAEGPSRLARWVEEVLAYLRWDGGTYAAKDRELVAKTVQGLEPHIALRMMARAVAAAQRGGDFPARVVEERDQLLRDGVLEVRRRDDDVALSVGGLGHLRAWLEEVGALYEDHAAAPSEQTRRLLPKGVLLAGLPGCGKSLAAELASATLGIPLLQLHMGRLMGRYLGESEGNLERALAQARASAPCVLWVDEIEKAVGGSASGEGGGTTGRMLGMLLSWMQDNDHGVFIFATANRLEHVPIELLRRGRMDEHFVVRLPTRAEAREILQKSALSLKWGGATVVEAATLDALVGERGKKALIFDADNVATYSGADLDALVREAARDARLRDPGAAQLTRANFDEVLKRGYKPQAKQFLKQFEEMEKQLKQYSFREASAKDGEVVGARRRKGEARALPTQLHALLHGPLSYDLELHANGEMIARIHIATRADARTACVVVGDSKTLGCQGQLRRRGDSVIATLNEEFPAMLELTTHQNLMTVENSYWGRHQDVKCTLREVSAAGKAKKSIHTTDDTSPTESTRKLPAGRHTFRHGSAEFAFRCETAIGKSIQLIEIIRTQGPAQPDTAEIYFDRGPRCTANIIETRRNGRAIEVVEIFGFFATGTTALHLPLPKTARSSR